MKVVERSGSTSTTTLPGDSGGKGKEEAEPGLSGADCRTLPQ